MKRLIPLAALSLFSCVSSMTTGTQTSDSTADAYIRAAGSRFETAFNAGNADDIVAFYTDDAVLLPPNSDTMTGATGIRGTFGPLIGAKANMDLNTDRIVQSCDVAYEYGTYTMRWNGPDGTPMNDRGKFVTIWRKMPNGDWKIAVDTFNTSMPPPGM